MKTRWGSCNPQARRIWLNLELAKKPVACLQYILVHEMVHLLERRHTARFRELMDTLLPSWQLCGDELNDAPLAHAEWRSDRGPHLHWSAIETPCQRPPSARGRLGRVRR